MSDSKQGVNIAFIGLNLKAQLACAEYLKTNVNFKRLDLDDALKRFIKTSYTLRPKKRYKIYDMYALYDAIYSADNNIFIEYIEGRLKNQERDVVISSVRYLNEVKRLQELGFHVVRVTTDTQRLRPEQTIKTATEGTTAVALKYDRNFAANNDVPNTVHWTSHSTTGALMRTLLTNLGYKFDL